MLRWTVASSSSLKRKLKTLALLFFLIYPRIISFLQSLKLFAVIQCQKIPTTSSFEPGLLYVRTSETITTAISAIGIAKITARILPCLFW